jgi:DamX protein
MSLARDHRVLELSSQAALLERISLLTHFGSNFVHVSGEVGAGKTWLAQRYLETWAQDKNQSLLFCYHSQSDSQRRHTILSQLRSNASFDPDVDLVESFYELMEEESCNIVIVVDDAQQLSEVMIGELWMLVLEAQSKPKWTISVVLFALPNLLDSLLARLSYGQEQKPIDLEIETLPQNDADRFFEFSVMRFVADDMEHSVRIAYSKVKKVPGEIMALGELKMEKRIIIRSIVGSPINIAIVVVLLALTIGGGYWWFLNQLSTPNIDNNTADQTVAPNGQQAQTAIPTLTQKMSNTETDGQEQGQSVANTNADNQGGGVVSENNTSALTSDSAMLASRTVPSSVKPDPNADDDSNSLPPSVSANGDNVGIDDDARQRVVITSDVVDALMDNVTKPSQQVDAAAINAGLLTATSGRVVSGVATEETVLSTTNTATVITSADATDAQLGQLAQAVFEPTIPTSTAQAQPINAETKVESPVPVVENTAVVTQTVTPPTSDESRLLAMPERSYTLQLAAFNNSQDVERFINTNQLSGKANVYKTIRKDVTWLIITYGNFSTLQLARDATESLPRPVQELSPWAKSLRQVHREIELGK